MNQLNEKENDKPPFFKTWKGMYWLVMGALLFQIVLYYAITRFFE
jgi:hypothetical protein